MIWKWLLLPVSCTLGGKFNGQRLHLESLVMQEVTKDGRDMWLHLLFNVLTDSGMFDLHKAESVDAFWECNGFSVLNCKMLQFYLFIFLVFFKMHEKSCCPPTPGWRISKKDGIGCGKSQCVQSGHKDIFKLKTMFLLTFVLRYTMNYLLSLFFPHIDPSLVQGGILDWGRSYVQPLLAGPSCE